MLASTIQELTDVGFSPVSSCLILALLAVVGVVAKLHNKSIADRETWHAETRARVVAMEGHVKACDDDRQKLTNEQILLKDRMDRFIRCPKSDCPNRLP